MAPSSSSGDGSVVKSQLNKLSEERTSLNAKVLESEEQLKILQDSVHANLEPCLKDLSDLKSNFEVLKSKIHSDQVGFQEFCQMLTNQILSKVVKTNENSSKRYSLVIEDIESRVRKESESDLDKVRTQLELELQKLEDCHREIDIYRQQLEQASQEVDKVKADLIEAQETFDAEKQKLKEKNGLEKAEIVKQLTLEHEIELSALREELENSEKVANCEAEVKRLREVMGKKEDDIEALRRKTRLMEINQEEKFHEEKDKIVQILEAGFSQREKLAVQKCEEELTEKFEKEIDKAKEASEENIIEALETLKEKQRVEMEAKILEIDLEHKIALENMVKKATEDLQKKYQEEKESALKMQEQKLTMKAKREVDGLRKRFKVMQTTGAFERSPSCSESEVSIEVRFCDLLRERLRELMLGLSRK